MGRPPVAAPSIGRFVDVSAPLPWQVQGPPDYPGALPIPETTAVLLADLDGDGRDEVIVSPTRSMPSRTPVVFRLADQRLAALPIVLPTGVSIRAAADLDGDGTTDLVAGGPVILWGDGHGGFAAPAPLTATPSDSEALALADVDGDGWLDVLQFLAGPEAGPQRVALFLRTGPRTFALAPDLIDRVSSGECDSLGVVDLQGEPTIVLNIGHGQDVPMPLFYRRGADRRWHAAELLPAGVRRDNIGMGAPMGSTACDLDGDGHADYVMMLDPETAFFSGTPAGPLRDHSDEAGLVHLPPAPGHAYPQMGWAGACLDLDGDGRLDLLQVCGNDAGGFFDPRHESGPQPIKVWTHVGDGWQMGDMTATVGLGQMGQWHSLSVGDLDGDGAPDFAVGGFGEAPRIYLNRTGVPSAALRLRTARGQPAYNVHVEVPGGGGRPAQHLVAGGIVSPLSQSDAIVFVPGGVAVRVGGAAAVPFQPGHATTVAVEP